MLMPTYDTREDAEAAGWTKTVPAGWTVRDTSGPDSFGYEYTATSPTGREVKTEAVWIRNLTNMGGQSGAWSNYYCASEFKEEEDAG